MSDTPEAGAKQDPFDLCIDDTVYRTATTRKFRQRRPWQPHDPTQVATLIPGLIVEILVKPGDPVVRGQGLVVLEAMKMRNEVQTSRSGTVASIAVTVGQNVPKGTVLVELTPATD